MSSSSSVIGRQEILLCSDWLNSVADGMYLRSDWLNSLADNERKQKKNQLINNLILV